MNRRRCLIFAIFGCLIQLAFHSSALAATSYGYSSPIYLNTTAVPEMMHIIGRVRDNASDYPLANAWVQLGAGQGAPGSYTWHDGRFSILNIDPNEFPPGTHTLYINRQDYKSTSDEITLIAGQTIEANPVLETKVVFLVHGMNSSGDTWRQEWPPGSGETFETRLEQAGYNFINVTLNASCDHIANNAELLREFINPLLVASGVQSYSVVAHSAGGLVTRQSLVNASGKMVRNLIMLGTPNHGSPFASKVKWVPQLAKNIFCGHDNSEIISELVPGSGVLNLLNYGLVDYQGNTDACSDHARNERRYGVKSENIYAIAGTNRCSIKYKAITKFVCDPDDGLVPVNSARLYSGTYFWTDTDLDCVAEHKADRNECLSLTANPCIADVVIDILNNQPPTRPSTSKTTQTQDPLELLPIISGYVATNETFMDSTLVTLSNEAVFMCTWEADSLVYTLRSPSGTIIDPYFAEGSPDIEYDGDGEVALYTIQYPESGYWKHMVHAPATAEAESLWVLVGLESQLRISGSVTKNVMPDEFFEISAVFLDGGLPLPHGSVEATVTLPDQSTTSVLLRDDGTGGDTVPGDGHYFALFPAGGVTGDFSFLMTATADTTQPGSEQRVTADISRSEVLPDVSVVDSAIQIANTQPALGALVPISVEFRNDGYAIADSVRLVLANETYGVALVDTVVTLVPGASFLVQTDWFAASVDSTLFRAWAFLGGSNELSYDNNVAWGSAFVPTPEGGVTSVPDDGEGSTDDGTQDNLAGIDGRVVLFPNSPNPFNPITKIEFYIPSGQRLVEVSIYDVAGRRVRRLLNEVFGSGLHSVAWDSRSDSGELLASGVYFCRLLVGDEVRTRKMTVIK